MQYGILLLEARIGGAPDFAHAARADALEIS
jgi:hypothetical protein